MKFLIFTLLISFTSLTHSQTIESLLAIIYKEYYRSHSHVEIMGAIIQTQTGYRYTAQKNPKGTSDKITVKFKIRKDEVLLGIWHTHGRRTGSSSYFSATDVELANKINKPVYLLHQRQVKVYRPSDSIIGWRRARMLGLSKGSATGRVVYDF